jgi:hypothetical protein
LQIITLRRKNVPSFSAKRGRDTFCWVCYPQTGIARSAGFSGIGACPLVFVNTKGVQSCETGFLRLQDLYRQQVMDKVQNKETGHGSLLIILMVTGEDYNRLNPFVQFSLLCVYLISLQLKYCLFKFVLK